MCVFPYFEAWQVHKGVQIDGLLLSCERTADCPDSEHVHGARYLTPFSPAFPHFEVSSNKYVDGN